MPRLDDPPPRDGKAGRRLLPEILLSSGAVVLILGLLGLLELGLRVIHPDYLRELDAGGLRRLHTYSDVYGWELRRGFGGGGERRTTINHLGYRGREHGFARSAGTTRIVMLGDSVAFGFEVGDEETFSALMESAEEGLEVVNLAVPGWGTDQELIRLEREGLAYAPDVVILNFCLENDFVDNALAVFFYDGVHPKPFFRLEGGALSLHDAHLRLSLPERLALLLRERSHLFNSLFPPPVADRQGRWQEKRREVLRDRAAVVDLTFRLIERMEARARAAGAEFVVLVYPNKAAFQGEESLLDEFYRLPRLGSTTVVDMGEPFRARYSRFRDFALDSIGHLNPEGHRAASEIIRGVLSDLGLARRQAAQGSPRPIEVVPDECGHGPHRQGQNGLVDVEVLGVGSTRW